MGNSEKLHEVPNAHSEVVSEPGCRAEIGSRVRHTLSHISGLSPTCQRTPSPAGNRDAGAGAECSLNIPKRSSDSHGRRREGEERRLFKNSKTPSLVL